MLSRHTPPEDVLRRALAHAGIVAEYLHVCRKKGCGHAESAQDPGLRHCPKDRMKLWPKAKVRPIRFHDLRHTTASLLMMAGANPASVQKILRYSNVKTTTTVYGHLLPGYLRSEIDRLSFEPEGSKSAAAASSDSPPVAADGKKFATHLLPAREKGSIGPFDAAPPHEARIDETPPDFSEGVSAGWTGLEPAASGVTGRRYNQLNYHPMLERP
jgi:integrase